MRTLCLTAMLALVSAGVVAKPPFLRGAAILKGDLYGDTYLEITKHITQTSLILAGAAHCGAAPPAVWSFHLVVATKDQPIDGYLKLDARTGKMRCASLPFLD